MDGKRGACAGRQTNPDPVGMRGEGDPVWSKGGIKYAN